jgi:tetratricopeptide (TPR) repeat protein
VVFSGACTLPVLQSQPQSELPAYVYTQPPPARYKDASVGILAFASPRHAPGSGRRAAEILYRQLQQRRVFGRVLPLFELTPQGTPSPEAVARSQQLDLLIGGIVHEYFEGSNLLASRVTQEIRATDPASGATVWLAETVAEGQPVPEKDFVFFQHPGKAAPPAEILMRRNADEFINLFASGLKPPPAGSEMQRRLEEGYQSLRNGDYDQAQSSFESVLRLDPDNPYALFNLGVLFQEQGRNADARQAFQRVVDLKAEFPVETTGASTEHADLLMEQARMRLKWLGRKNL